MLRRLAPFLAAVLLVPSLAACGSDEKKSDSAGKQLSAVTFSGDVGKSLKATWKTKLATPKETKVTTLVKGKGVKIASGDTVTTYLWLGDGTTKKEAYNDYKNGTPQSIPNSEQLDATFKKLFVGATYGSRVVAVTTAKELFGSDQGNSQLGIGGNDNLVLVADFVKKAETSPEPKDNKVHDAAASTMPKVVETKGKPTGFDWSGIEEPDKATPVQRVILKQGKGKAIKATDTITVNYLGETYKADKPFDESYSKTPLNQPLSGLIQGWSIGLTGVKVGSRVLLQIPPALAYGAQASGDIPANSTLWFVIDVVKVG